MKYLIYTPSYHSLHHSKVHTNFCLFVPFYDYVYGTLDPTSHQLYTKAGSRHNHLTNRATINTIT
jgi:sterol desaturase/sphingolipid hydroxylase (fatty acid hydroxylase superfamily)